MPFNIGDKVTAPMFNLFAPLFARKTADEGVTSNTTLQSDDHLSVALTANSAYTISGLLMVTGANAGDIKLTWAIPSNATIHYAFPSVHNGATATGAITEWFAVQNQTASDGFAIPIGTVAGGTSAIQPCGLVVTTITAGALTLRWAQNASDATATTLKAGSWIRLDRVE